MVIVEKTDTTNVGKDVRNLEPSVITGGNLHDPATLETAWQTVKNFDINLPWLGNSILR